MAEQHQEIFIRGNGPWKIKTYKESTLTALLIDLAALEDIGIEDSCCTHIKNALNKALALSSSMPAGSAFVTTYWTHLERFRDTYEDWNELRNGRNDAKQRRLLHFRLDTIKEKMWNFFRHSDKRGTMYWDEQLELLASADSELLDEMHLAFVSLIESYPTIFPTLVRRIKAYQKIIG